MTKTPRPTNPYNLISTLLSPLVLWQFQLLPRRQGRVGHAEERLAASVDCEGELRHIPEGGRRKFGKYTEGVTISVAREGDPTKLGYLAFDPGGLSTINWSPTGGKVS